MCVAWVGSYLVMYNDVKVDPKFYWISDEISGAVRVGEHIRMTEAILGRKVGEFSEKNLKRISDEIIGGFSKKKPLDEFLKKPSEEF